MATNESNDREHFVLPPAIFYMLLTAAGLGGGGIYGFVGPKMEETVVRECTNNSEKALDYSLQVGRELEALRNDVSALHRNLDDRTRFRYTAEDAGREAIKQNARDTHQERRLDWLEKQHETR